MTRVIHGDCRDVLPDLPSESFDCILTDPPYGETSLEWDRWPPGWPALCRRLVKTTGSMWVFGSFRMFLEHRDEFSGWRHSQEIVWEKHNGTGLFNDRFRRVHELAVHFYRDDAKWSDVFKAPQFTNDATARTVRMKGRPAQWIGARGESLYRSEDGGPRLMRSVQYARSEHGRAEHPTQKPLGIVEPLLRYACPVSGSVLDPFAGSGTVGIAAKRHGCDATLIEARAEFISIIDARIANDAPLFAGAAP
jgi:site-specific DNA-methyltransferase (adenine-specific)